MSYLEWIAQLDRVRAQYMEGAITDREFFNRVVADAFEVDQTDVPDIAFADDDPLTDINNIAVNRGWK